MPRTICKSDKPLYINTFPSWKGRQPLRFFMMENLLEARRGSEFPTNGYGPDEEVNVFLAGLLTDFLAGKHDSKVKMGAECTFYPPPKDQSRRQRAEYYLANANARLLFLGLFDRGDPLRRHAASFGFSPADTRIRDLNIGADCFRMAVNLTEGRGIFPAEVVSVLKKLAENFVDYVHVLAVMATRRLGLGASLNHGQLNRMLNESLTADLKMGPAQNPPPLAPCDNPDTDHLLDQILDYRRCPSRAKEGNIKILARRIGLDPETILAK